MWLATGSNLQMTEGDWGVALPVEIDGITLSENDAIRFTIKRGETALIEKDFTSITDNTVSLELTKAESDLLPVGNYSYVLDWYQSGAFMCNIVPRGFFKVGDKA